VFFRQTDNVRYILLILLAQAIYACQSSCDLKNIQGEYTLLFSAGEHSIPARLSINPADSWIIHNAEELITLDSIIFKSDSFFIQLPLFDSEMKGVLRNDSLIGVWTDYSRVDYQIPFVAIKKEKPASSPITNQLRYKITFSAGDSSQSSVGVAEFIARGKSITGTVLTESGDYRYLEGEIDSDSIWLSAFDGTHLFYLRGEMRSDSIINGVFLSGKHWQEPWVAAKDNGFSLRDPYTITQCNINKNPVFTVINESGESVTFDSSRWQNHASIIQIMGSWCPNCTDESRFFKSLYEKHNTAGMQIIPLAFERGDNIKAACERVRKQFNQLGLPYPFYYGGKSSRSDALQTLTFLQEVNSFPTSIFIDKKGNIRRVYTGFYGPGTGQEYTKHCASISALVDSLIAE